MACVRREEGLLIEENNGKRRTRMKEEAVTVHDDKGEEKGSRRITEREPDETVAAQLIAGG